MRLKIEVPAQVDIEINKITFVQKYCALGIGLNTYPFCEVFLEISKGESYDNYSRMVNNGVFCMVFGEDKQLGKEKNYEGRNNKCQW